MISYNDALTSLIGLGNLTSMGDNFSIFHNSMMTSPMGLESLTSIGGYLYFGYNDALTNLTGMESLTSVGGEGLGITGNIVLTSLTGLENIDAGSIEALYINENPSLFQCAVQSICDFLASPNGEINIYGNAYGCNSQAQVEAACDAVGVEIVVIENEYSLFPNPANQTITITTKDRTIIQEVTIYNQTGQKVMQGKPVNNTLDVSQLQPGIYIIKVKTIEGNVREKLIIQ